MTAYLIPEIWCDNCGTRAQADDECTTRGLRQHLSEDREWVRRRISGELHDICGRCVEGDQ